MNVKFYLGRFGEERFLFEDLYSKIVPEKSSFVFFDDVCYKVMYSMIDYDHNEYSVFLREAIEEDF